mgnify:CR=1 FL=1
MPAIVIEVSPRKGPEAAAVPPPILEERLDPIRATVLMPAMVIEVVSSRKGPTTTKVLVPVMQ